MYSQKYLLKNRKKKSRWITKGNNCKILGPESICKNPCIPGYIFLKFPAHIPQEIFKNIPEVIS